MDKTKDTNGLVLRIIVLQCVSYAIFSAVTYRNSFAEIMTSQLALGDWGTMASSLLAFAASGLTCMAVCLLSRNGIDVMRPHVIYGSYVLAGLINIGLVYTTSEGVGHVLSLLLGISGGVPLLFCFDGYYCIYRMAGGPLCIASIAAGSTLSTLGALAVGALNGHHVAMLLVIVAGSVVAPLCQQVIMRLGAQSLTMSTGGKDAQHKPEKYQLSPYIAFTIASFGVMAGLSRGFSVVDYGGIGGSSAWFQVLAMAGACAGVLAYAWVCRRSTGTQFGLLIRLSLAISGVTFAAAPLLCEVAPWLLRVLCAAVYAVQGVAMTLISVEISYERRLSTVAVMPVNYIVYVAFGCASMLVPVALFNRLDVHAAWDVMALVAVATSVAVIPALPSTTSSASTFALKHLPENQNYEDRTAQARESVIAKYGLSPRESEVLGLLVKGMTRAQIAQELSLSSWTVKEYVAGVYGKVGVHSAKELMLMVASGEGK